MTRKATTAPADGRRDYFRLENRLVLVAWRNSLFGYEHNRDMLKDLAEVGEGVDSTGRSHLTSRLLSRGDKFFCDDSAKPLPGAGGANNEETGFDPDYELQARKSEFA